MEANDPTTSTANATALSEGPKPGPQSKSIYETVTSRILTQLEQGRIPWRKTWTSGLPKNLTTGHEYRGVNILILATAEHTSRYWVSYRQAIRVGGHVRKGEKATPIVYWKWRSTDDIKKLREKTGKESFAPCIPFVSAVFNLDQVESIKRPDDDLPQLPPRRLEIAEKVYEVMPDKPHIEHSVTHHPAYSRSLDRVLLPHLSQFESGAEYYATLFHELVHNAAIRIMPRRSLDTVLSGAAVRHNQRASRKASSLSSGR